MLEGGSRLRLYKCMVLESLPVSRYGVEGAYGSLTRNTSAVDSRQLLLYHYPWSLTILTLL
jgi:hypothetical protein